MKKFVRGLISIILSFVLVVLLFLISLPAKPIRAQTSSVNCGDIIKGEFSSPNTLQRYEITLSPGDKLTVSTRADGKFLMGQVILGPSDLGIAASPSGGYGAPNTYVQQNTDVSTGVLSAYGIYTIVVSNAFLGTVSGEIGGTTEETNTGTYQLLIGCRFANGLLIEPGNSTASPPPSSKPDTITLPIAVINGNIPQSIQCGDAITTEFTENNEIHNYLLTMEPGDVSFRLNVAPSGDHLLTAIGVADTAGKKLASTPNYARVRKDASIDLDVPSTGAEYRIYIANTELSVYNINQLADPDAKFEMGGVGIYTLLVSCKLQDGSNIIPNPETAAQPSAEAPTPSVSSSTLDIAKLIKIPLVAGMAMSGAVTPTGDEAFGYTIDANANSSLTVNFTRVQGNLNLGLMILSADGNTQLYQSNLFGTQNTSIRITVPADGQYIIALFRTDPVPDAAEPTAFTIQVDVNPQ